MYLSKIIPIELYDTKVEFILTSNIVRTFNRIQKYHRTEVKWKKNEAAAACTIVCNMSKYSIIIHEPYCSYNTICHELYHCVCNLAADRGVHEEEARAWVQGIIAQEIFNFLREKKIKIE
jgi:hypothetical protein